MALIFKRNPVCKRKLHSGTWFSTKSFMTFCDHGLQLQWGPQGCLDSSLTHSLQQLFQIQSHLSKTLTLTPIPHSQEITFTPTQQEKQKSLRVNSFNLLTSDVYWVFFLFSCHLYQSTKIVVTTAAHGLTFSHSLIWPRHNLILKRTSIILKKHPYCCLFTHWLVWILHFSQTTVVISILGI